MRVLYLCINKANKENIENLTKLPFYHCSTCTVESLGYDIHSKLYANNEFTFV